MAQGVQAEVGYEEVRGPGVLEIVSPGSDHSQVQRPDELGHNACSFDSSARRLLLRRVCAWARPCEGIALLVTGDRFKDCGAEKDESHQEDLEV